MDSDCRATVGLFVSPVHLSPSPSLSPSYPILHPFYPTHKICIHFIHHTRVYLPTQSFLLPHPSVPSPFLTSPTPTASHPHPSCFSLSLSAPVFLLPYPLRSLSFRYPSAPPLLSLSFCSSSTLPRPLPPPLAPSPHGFPAEVICLFFISSELI